MEVDEFSDTYDSSKTWKGASISELCNGKGPWSFSITPVTASKYHAVLYELPVALQKPPSPHRSSNPSHWDENHVRMPFSEKNLYPVVENEKQIIKQRWNIIKESMSQTITNSRDLEKAIKSYTSSLPEFDALHYFFEEIVEEEDATLFFEHLLPKIVKLALDLPNILPGSLPLLKKGSSRSVSLSQLQISSILANAFLCTFPWRKDMAGSYPGINFSKLFAADARKDRRSAIVEKLKCIFHYFRRVTEKVPVGVVTFERRFKPKSNMYRWDTSDSYLGKVRININSSGTIEDDGLGFLQVDFANKNVGGGVLGYGCVQEEIRFVICPELLVSRLFIERLGDQDAVIVTGPERYSKYSGYSNTFTWEGDNVDDIPYDEYGRRRTSICIIDATHFTKQIDQFYPSAMLRELNKAYVGFSSRQKENLAPVATGNWGCGAFNGSTFLKALLQLMVCTAVERDLVYYTFGNEDLRDKFFDMYHFLSSNNVTIGTLWKFLCGFSSQKISEDRLYAYIQQAFFDNKKQPKLKHFFSMSFKKKDNEKPSTSGVKPMIIQSSPEAPSSSKESYKSETNMEINSDCFDDDIIPPTPPPEINKSKKVFTKTKSKSIEKEIVHKLPKTDIIELIEAIDGTPPAKVVEEESFLTHIDNLSKKMKVDSPDEESPEIIETSQEIEIESLMSFSSKSRSSSINDAKGTKKLISDYFQKSFKSS